MGNSSKSAAKKFVSVRGNVSIPGGSDFRGIAVDLVSTRDGSYRQLPVATDGSFGENLKLKGGISLTARDANGKEPNFTRIDGLSGNIGERIASTSLILKPQKKSSYSAQINFTEIPDPITGLPLPPTPDSGLYTKRSQSSLAVREDQGVLEWNQSRDSSIGKWDETDWYRVALGSGNTYNFSYYKTNNELVMLLYNANGQLMLDPTNRSLGFDYSPPVSGTYFLAVGYPSANPEVYETSYAIEFR